MLLAFFPCTVQVPALPSGPHRWAASKVVICPSFPHFDDEHKEMSSVSIGENVFNGQERHAVLSLFTYESCTQTLQIADPMLGLYLPDTQAEQPPSDPVQPALHKHLVMLILPDKESEFSGQSTQ